MEQKERKNKKGTQAIDKEENHSYKEVTEQAMNHKMWKKLR